jgi:hypothetical protein
LDRRLRREPAEALAVGQPPRPPFCSLLLTGGIFGGFATARGLMRRGKCLQRPPSSTNSCDRATAPAENERPADHGEFSRHLQNALRTMSASST